MTKAPQSGRTTHSDIWVIESSSVVSSTQMSPLARPESTDTVSMVTAPEAPDVARSTSEPPCDDGTGRGRRGRAGSHLGDKDTARVYPTRRSATSEMVGASLGSTDVDGDYGAEDDKPLFAWLPPEEQAVAPSLRVGRRPRSSADSAGSSRVGIGAIRIRAGTRSLFAVLWALALLAGAVGALTASG